MDLAPNRVAAEMRFAQRLSAPLTIRRGRLRGWAFRIRTGESVGTYLIGICDNLARGRRKPGGDTSRGWRMPRNSIFLGVLYLV